MWQSTVTPVTPSYFRPTSTISLPDAKTVKLWTISENASSTVCIRAPYGHTQVTMVHMRAPYGHTEAVKLNAILEKA